MMAASRSTVLVWAEMIKFSHSVFALPFALMAAFLAGRERASGLPAAWQLTLIVVCMVAARSAAMTFNRIVDARIDARNPRTAGRPLVAGSINRFQAILFFVACCIVFVAACAGFLVVDDNVWPILLAGPVLAYICGYSYTKRFTPWSHFVLGSAIACSPVAAWLAIHPASIGWPAIVLMAAVTCWIGGFDIIYACQDVEIDRRHGLRSLPARLGVARALWITRGAHLATVAMLAGLAPLASLGWLYGIGVATVAVLLLIENRLVRADDLSRVNVAFFTVNGVVSLVLGGLAIADILVVSPG
ncbi:MAG: 4-hydroxybenzoate octaprenyltransferase [Phycisphaerae bacterium]|nr:4-hydroxybenzoate octaprenyltransferase [Phycisphaerae bacterium]